MNIGFSLNLRTFLQIDSFKHALFGKVAMAWMFPLCIDWKSDSSNDHAFVLNF